MTADGAASPDVPAAAASELGPSAEAVPGNQVPVGPAGVLEPVAEEPAAMQPDAAAAQGAPEGSAADVTAVAQVAKQPSVAFRLAGEGAAQQVGCGLCLGPVRQWLPGTSWTSALTSASRAAACSAAKAVYGLAWWAQGYSRCAKGYVCFALAVDSHGAISVLNGLPFSRAWYSAWLAWDTPRAQEVGSGLQVRPAWQQTAVVHLQPVQHFVLLRGKLCLPAAMRSESRWQLLGQPFSVDWLAAVVSHKFP